MLVLPKMPSSLTLLCSAESRPFERPVSFANICAIICRARDPLHQESAEIAVQRENPVVLPQAEAASDDDRFLPDARVDAAAHLALAHAKAEALVEARMNLSQ